MSVIVKNPNELYFKGFCKGSPEKIKELCKPDTIPSNFNTVLSKYTMKGFRVLALSAKMIKMEYMQSQKIERSVIESNMIFLGLLIVQNKLKEKTISSIETLQDADLRMVMATGDNILTAISVAKECGLISNGLPIYTCDLNKENSSNEFNLSWNLVDTFIDQDEDQDMIEEHLTELNIVRGRDDNIYNESNLKGITHHFYPESLNSAIQNMNGDKFLDNNEMKREIDNQMDSQIVNIDIKDYPKSQEEDYVIAVTGSTFEKIWKLHNKYLQTGFDRFKIHYDTFRLILKNCYIFARMSPDHKTILVECMRNEKFTVCMCGDGANDCGALKAADVGVSLSIEEASIAAPFTSNIPDISCLIKLFREGKASLVTSIQTFKYMMIYSIIQFVSVTILMMRKSYLTDNQFLASDVFIIFPMAILIARTGAYYKLTHHQPTGALISIPIISSILLQTLIVCLAQVGVLILIINQKWYVNECTTEFDSVSSCYDNTVYFFKLNLFRLFSLFLICNTLLQPLLFQFLSRLENLFILIIFFAFLLHSHLLIQFIS